MRMPYRLATRPEYRQLDRQNTSSSHTQSNPIVDSGEADDMPPEATEDIYKARSLPYASTETMLRQQQSRRRSQIALRPLERVNPLSIPHEMSEIPLFLRRHHPNPQEMAVLALAAPAHQADVIHDVHPTHRSTP